MFFIVEIKNFGILFDFLAVAVVQREARSFTFGGLEIGKAPTRLSTLRKKPSKAAAEAAAAEEGDDDSVVFLILS